MAASYSCRSPLYTIPSLNIYYMQIKDVNAFLENIMYKFIRDYKLKIREIRMGNLGNSLSLPPNHDNRLRLLSPSMTIQSYTHWYRTFTMMAQWMAKSGYVHAIAEQYPNNITWPAPEEWSIT